MRAFAPCPRNKHSPQMWVAEIIRLSGQFSLERSQIRRVAGDRVARGVQALGGARPVWKYDRFEEGDAGFHPVNQNAEQPARLVCHRLRVICH